MMLSTHTQCVTGYIGDHLFGIPIAWTRNVFRIERLTPVPLSGPMIAGVLNLRGRIVTMIDMRARLGLQPRRIGERQMAIGIDHLGESYGLMVDSVSDVLPVRDVVEQVPPHFDYRIADVASGVCNLENRFLIMLDLDRVLDIDIGERAA
jgi:purine-binding chemotaxis protein CheW